MKRHCVLYSDAIPKALVRFKPAEVIERLLRFDRLILGSMTFYDAMNLDHSQAFADALIERSYLYFNLWGKDSHRTMDHGWPEWQLAPGDLGQPVVRTSAGVYCYRMDDAHIRVLLTAWLWPALRERRNSDGVMPGVFFDDHSGDRRHWILPDKLKDEIWRPADGEGGWRNGADWNLDRMEHAELATLPMVGRGKAGVIVNGKARVKSPRFWEGFGRWESPQVVMLQAKPGDFLEVNGLLLASDGRKVWAAADATDAAYGGFSEGTSFRLVWETALKIAAEKDLSVGLSFRKRSDATIYSHLWTEKEVPA